MSSQVKHRIGIIGLVIGLIAVGIAIFQDDLRAEIIPEDTPVVEVEKKEAPSFKELAIKVSKRVIQDKILKEDNAAHLPPVEEDELHAPHDSIALIYTGLGFLAMVLGIISWVKKEHIRIAGGAISLGLVAIAWQYVLIGVGIAIIILILANFSA